MIERAQSHHLKELVNICYEYYLESPQQEIVPFEADVCMDYLRRAMILPQYHFLIYTYDGVPQGGALGYLSPYAFSKTLRCNLEYIFVRTSHRNTDCAKQLVRGLEDWAKENSVMEIATGDIGFNVEHISKWYQSQGYEYKGACLTKRL